MNIYVDPLRPCNPSRKWPHPQSCHLVTDAPSLDDLHTFAEQIGLKRAWFQNHPLLPHYDLTPGKRSEAIRSGARSISFNRLYQIVQKRKELNSNGMSNMPLGDQGQGFAPEAEYGLSQA